MYIVERLRNFISFPVKLRNRLIYGGLKPVLSHTAKLCIAYYIQFSTNLRHLGANKTGFNLVILHFYIHGKLFIIRCNE